MSLKACRQTKICPSPVPAHSLPQSSSHSSRNYPQKYWSRVARGPTLQYSRTGHATAEDRDFSSEHEVRLQSPHATKAPPPIYKRLKTQTSSSTARGCKTQLCVGAGESGDQSSPQRGRLEKNIRIIKQDFAVGEINPKEAETSRVVGVPQLYMKQMTTTRQVVGR